MRFRQFFRHSDMVVVINTALLVRSGGERGKNQVGGTRVSAIEASTSGLAGAMQRLYLSGFSHLPLSSASYGTRRNPRGNVKSIYSSILSRALYCHSVLFDRPFYHHTWCYPKCSTVQTAMWPMQLYHAVHVSMASLHALANGL